MCSVNKGRGGGLHGAVCPNQLITKSLESNEITATHVYLYANVVQSWGGQNTRASSAKPTLLKVPQTGKTPAERG